MAAYLIADIEMERFEAWYDSPEYAPALALRKRASVSSLVMTEGAAGTND